MRLGRLEFSSPEIFNSPKLGNWDGLHFGRAAGDHPAKAIADILRARLPPGCSVTELFPKMTTGMRIRGLLQRAKDAKDRKFSWLPTACS